MVLIRAGGHLHGYAIHLLLQVELEVVERPYFFARLRIYLLGRIARVPRRVPEVLHITVNEYAEVFTFLRVRSVGVDLVGRGHETIHLAEVEPLLHFVRSRIRYGLAIESKLFVDIVILQVLSLLYELLELVVEFGLESILFDELEVFFRHGADGPAGSRCSLFPCHGVGIVASSMDTGNYTIANPVVIIEEGPESRILGAGLHGVEVNLLVEVRLSYRGHLLVVGVDNVDVATRSVVLEVVAVLHRRIDYLPYHVLQTALLIPVVALKLTVINEGVVDVRAISRREAPLQTVLRSVSIGLGIAINIVEVLIERTTLRVTPAGEDVVAGLERHETVKESLISLEERVGECLSIALVGILASIPGSLEGFQSLFAVLAGVDTRLVCSSVEAVGEEFSHHSIEIAEGIHLVNRINEPSVRVVVRTARYVASGSARAKSEQIGVSAVLVSSIVSICRYDDDSLVSSTVSNVRKVEGLTIGLSLCQISSHASQVFFAVLGRVAVVALHDVARLYADLPCTVGGGSVEIVIARTIEVVALIVLDEVNRRTVSGFFASSLEGVQAGSRQVAGEIKASARQERISSCQLRLSALESILHTHFDVIGRDSIVSLVVTLSRSGHTSCSKKRCHSKKL